ncbi:MAG: WD40 repeat domain-containing protein [Pseudomonadota bacterium]
MIRVSAISLGIFGLVVALAAPIAAQQIVLQQLPPARTLGAEPPPQVLNLSFDASDAQIIGHLSDGSIYAWPWDGTAPQLIAQTEQAFAYCPAGERMVISAGKAAVLLSLQDGAYAALSEGLYDHAAFNSDCSVMILAESATNAVEHWQISEAPVLRTAATLAPVQSGVAVSPDGRFFAAATAPNLEEETVGTAIEVFQISEDNRVQRTGRLEVPDTVLGLDGMDLTTSSVLVVASRAEDSAGILAANPAKDEQIWSWRGLATERITAVELSSDELLLLTGDQAGRIVLWSVSGGENLAEINLGQPVTAATLSKDVSRAAVALKDGRVLVLDVDALVAAN